MLPFLKPKAANQVGLIIKTREPDEKPDETNDDSGDHAIGACARDLISAVHARDEKGVSEALRAAFEILESEPDNDMEDDSYEAQNIKAGEQS